ncbi:hypothetical protein N3K66_002375 [Trichothecium roseum]|uniref:Uncharacterized protein n=1 Tax=Trichothecium roseum TaxID=47278 RepID=A0ACC0VC27_9HYPO|nr:hypothetical protein N3K66_002375 [Trichothecium roseum]
MATRTPPDYYAILEIPEASTTDEIRSAYKRAALKTHPDRVATDSPERAERTRKFQLVNDAYYTLSDPTRRRDYNAQRRMFGGGGGPAGNTRSSNNSKSTPAYDPFADPEVDDDEGIPAPGAGTGAGAGPNTYSWAWNFFTNNHGGQDRQQQEDDQFEDIFEEMMREEGMAEGDNRPTGKFWSMLGGLSGGAMGFIVANVPGLVAGAVAGNRLGAVRDAKGKSVFAVFQDLPQGDRARLLSQLAARVFSHAVGV